MCPDKVQPSAEWVAYRNFKNAQPLLGYFAGKVDQPIIDRFSGNLPGLEAACKKLGGEAIEDDASYDLSIQLSALPRIPLFLRFNDKDDLLPATCIVLFQAATKEYIDMESLAIVGALFAEKLVNI